MRDRCTVEEYHEPGRSVFHVVERGEVVAVCAARLNAERVAAALNWFSEEVVPDLTIPEPPGSIRA